MRDGSEHHFPWVVPGVCPDGGGTGLLPSGLLATPQELVVTPSQLEGLLPTPQPANYGSHPEEGKRGRVDTGSNRMSIGHHGGKTDNRRRRTLGTKSRQQKALRGSRCPAVTWEMQCSLSVAPF